VVIGIINIKADISATSGNAVLMFEPSNILAGLKYYFIEILSMNKQWKVHSSEGNENVICIISIMAHMQ
jgi:hypothetical protein